MSLSKGDVATINAMYAKSGSGANDGQRLRCAKDKVVECVKNGGNDGCIATHCQGGDYICSNTARMTACAKARGGAACFTKAQGDCRG